MSDFDNLTMKELCKLAMECQDASNLSGVVHTFSKVLPRLRMLLEVEPGNFTVNSHPVTVMFSSKVASLSGSDDIEIFSEAYKYVKENILGILQSA